MTECCFFHSTNVVILRAIVRINLKEQKLIIRVKLSGVIGIINDLKEALLSFYVYLVLQNSYSNIKIFCKGTYAEISVRASIPFFLYWV